MIDTGVRENWDSQDTPDEQREQQSNSSTVGERIEEDLWCPFPTLPNEIDIRLPDPLTEEHRHKSNRRHKKSIRSSPFSPESSGNQHIIRKSNSHDGKIRSHPERETLEECHTSFSQGFLH